MYSRPSGGDGLGFWTALIPVGIALGKKAFTDDTPDMAAAVYYPDAKRGIVHCPGPHNVADVAEAYANLDGKTPEGGRLKQDIISLLGSDGAYRASGYGMPGDARGIAGALVAWAHGGRDCAREGTGGELRADALVTRLLEVESARRRSLAERAAEVAAVARARAAEVAAAEIVPGVSTPVLGLGALALVGALLYGRARP